jgi:thymidylate synthase
VGELVHVIADAHIYDRHIPIIKELIGRKPFDAPTFTIDKSVDDYYKFSTKSFTLDQYKFHDFKIKIPVAI